jgi:hypothetical protein
MTASDLSPLSTLFNPFSIPSSQWSGLWEDSCDPPQWVILSIATICTCSNSLTYYHSNFTEQSQVVIHLDSFDCWHLLCVLIPHRKYGIRRGRTDQYLSLNYGVDFELLNRHDALGFIFLVYNERMTIFPGIWWIMSSCSKRNDGLL